MEPTVDTALGEYSTGGVARELKGEDAGHVSFEGKGLEVEHQLDVFVKRIGHASRGTRQRPRFTAQVTGLDALDSPFNLTDVLQIPVHAPSIRGVELPLECGNFVGNEVEDTPLSLAAFGPRFFRAPSAKQLVESKAWVPYHG